MKKLLFLIFLSFAVMSAFSETESESDYNFSVNINSGFVGGGGIFSYSGSQPEVVVSITSLGIEHNRTNIGIEILPYTYYTRWVFSEGDENEYIWSQSFLNLKLYWDIYSDRLFYVGPFASVNYFFINNGIVWDKTTITAGVHLGIRSKEGLYNYNFLNVEAGYRYLDGKSNFFVGAKMDLVTFLLFFYGSYSSTRDPRFNE